MSQPDTELESTQTSDDNALAFLSQHREKVEQELQAAQ